MRLHKVIDEFLPNLIGEPKRLRTFAQMRACTRWGRERFCMQREQFRIDFSDKSRYNEEGYFTLVRKDFYP
jgi:hypothetical protein